MQNNSTGNVTSNILCPEGLCPDELCASCEFGCILNEDCIGQTTEECYNPGKLRIILICRYAWVFLFWITLVECISRPPVDFCYSDTHAWGEW